jgi:hypothetical protein
LTVDDEGFGQGVGAGDVVLALGRDGDDGGQDEGER